uniref:Prospero domain-containing protein n=1 Tax=Timema douglasi TaxID=61478 RepID=A0A7R8VAS2_TIMDO|nr:unnamed protein product [Timema douglasi]
MDRLEEKAALRWSIKRGERQRQRNNNTQEREKEKDKYWGRGKPPPCCQLANPPELRRRPGRGGETGETYPSPSPQEEAECFGLYGDKLLKKAKRTRQRVDAGEPRNSYSSIPNFSSRPSFLSGSIYGAIFTQSQQHFGLFGPGFGPAKMLNELLGRQVKQASDAAPDAAMMMDSASSDGTGGGGGGGVKIPLGANNNNFDCLNATSVIRRGLEEDGASPPPNELAHHMLRDILQGRKKELMQLEQELRNVSVSGNGDVGVNSPDNNNSINNNNNELKNGLLTGDCSDVEGGNANKQLNGGDMNMDADCNSVEDEAAAAAAMEEALSEVGVVTKKEKVDLMEDVMNGGGGSDSEQSLNSPESDSLPIDKEDESETPTVDVKEESLPCPPAANPKPEQMELKRARVENIVSSMRSSPSLPIQVNGCKKRKLYHPQQHDNSAAERYAASQYGLGLGILLDDDDELEPPEVRQKRVEKNALKNQLRTMQEQLAEMQQKYVQLCTRMEQESDCQDTEEVSSDLEQDGNSLPAPPEKPTPSTPVTTPVKEVIPCSPMANSVSSQPAMNNVAAMAPVSGSDLEGLADVLKTEITASLTNLVDSIVARFVQQRRFLGVKQSEAAVEQLNKDLLMASQLLDRKSPRTKVIDRGGAPGGGGPGGGVGGGNVGGPRINGNAFPSAGMSHGGGGGGGNPENNLNTMNLPHVRPSPNAAMFQTPKAPGGGGTGAVNNSAAAAALYSSMGGMGGGAPPHMNPFCLPENSREGMPEQNEALSLVVTPKKKRHKVTDTRITPRTVSRILAQDGMVPPPGPMEGSNGGVNPVSVKQFGGLMASTSGGAVGVEDSPPPPRPYHPPPPPILPVSLPTSVAIPNPSLHESQVFSPYSPFYHHQQAPPPQHQHMASSSPPGLGAMGGDPRGDSPPLPHPPTLLHPALIAAAQHGGSPDYGHMRGGVGGGGTDSVDRNSDCNSVDGPYDGNQPTISFNNKPWIPSTGREQDLVQLLRGQVRGREDDVRNEIAVLVGFLSRTGELQDKRLTFLTVHHSSTLTPMHLRKAKLMFFWVRYPSSAVLKMYFPDIKFNKNNTAQLVKWFSNFSYLKEGEGKMEGRVCIGLPSSPAPIFLIMTDCGEWRSLDAIAEWFGGGGVVGASRKKSNRMSEKGTLYPF